ncbi:MAG TPA: 5-(carboxyamino)imidazole ribonucleotide synthase [Patescibacteria group bacterium]
MDKQKTIGIVGGGQLGRMMIPPAHKLGFKVIVLDPTPDSPAGQIADKQIIGSFKDEEKIKELASQVDYLTFEIESANAKALEDLTKQGFPVNPSAQTLSIIKDKLKQKEFLQRAHIPTADFLPVENKQDILDVAQKFGYPFLLKARMDAYDGRGNALIKTEEDIDKGLEKLKARALYVEKFVPFVKELAVMVARSTVGEIMAYPVVETTHVRNICDTVVVPANISETITKNAKALGIKVMQELRGAGVFGIEMFLSKDNQVLVNEIAPRVHNSGHYSIETCQTSQFEQHIRAITGMELGATDLVVPAAAMVNILGEKEGDGEGVGIEKAKVIEGVSIHMYGKKESKIDRKMGHITAVGNTVEEALKKAREARAAISI